jgi:hypothetical protein
MAKVGKPISLIRSSRAPAVAADRIGAWARHQWSDRSHRLLTPMLADMLVGPTSQVFTDPALLLGKLFPDHDATRALAEYIEVKAELSQRRGTEEHIYPSTWGLQQAAGSLLYCLVRLGQMKEVWETGIADGASSFILLSALAKNGTGTLHSTDIRDNVGGLVHEDERTQWDIHILDQTRPALALKRYAATLPKLDLFVHDSLHRYGWQMSELKAAALLVKCGGFIASDDVDNSLAYPDFCRDRSLDPQYLLDVSRFFGVALKYRE